MIALADQRKFWTPTFRVFVRVPIPIPIPIRRSQISKSRRTSRWKTRKLGQPELREVIKGCELSFGVRSFVRSFSLRTLNLGPSTRCLNARCGLQLAPI